jgi:hypothetical protein
LRATAKLNAIRNWRFAMIRTLVLIGALAGVLLHALPAQAQRVFVSGGGSDSNPCTFAQPCRTFAQAFTTAPTNGEIDVLDPAGYGPLTITHGISIQAHGFGGITQATSGGTAITINAGSSDAITLNGLLIDGGGMVTQRPYNNGIVINEAGSVQILNSVIRHFGGEGVDFTPSNSPSNLLVLDTVLSDNGEGIDIDPANGQNIATATLRRITANNNVIGVNAVGQGVLAMISNSVFSNNDVGVSVSTGCTIWLGKSVVSGNTQIGVQAAGATNSYGNNAINDNASNTGSLTPAPLR